MKLIIKFYEDIKSFNDLGINDVIDVYGLINKILLFIKGRHRPLKRSLATKTIKLNVINCTEVLMVRLCY